MNYYECKFHTNLWYQFIFCTFMVWAQNYIRSKHEFIYLVLKSVLPSGKPTPCTTFGIYGYFWMSLNIPEVGPELTFPTNISHHSHGLNRAQASTVGVSGLELAIVACVAMVHRLRLLRYNHFRLPPMVSRHSSPAPSGQKGVSYLELPQLIGLQPLLQATAGQRGWLHTTLAPIQTQLS